MGLQGSQNTGAPSAPPLISLQLGPESAWGQELMLPTPFPELGSGQVYSPSPKTSFIGGFAKFPLPPSLAGGWGWVCGNAETSPPFLRAA